MRKKNMIIGSRCRNGRRSGFMGKENKVKGKVLRNWCGSHLKKKVKKRLNKKV